RASRRARRPGKPRYGRMRPMWGVVAAAADHDASSGPLTLDVLLWIRVELRFAARRAEVIRLALVLALADRLVLVDGHFANGIRHHVDPPRVASGAAGARCRSLKPS